MTARCGRSTLRRERQKRVAPAGFAQPNGVPADRDQHVVSAQKRDEMLGGRPSASTGV